MVFFNSPTLRRTKLVSFKTLTSNSYHVKLYYSIHILYIFVLILVYFNFAPFSKYVTKSID